MMLISCLVLGAIAMTEASVRNPQYPIGGPKNVIAVESASNFCMFLPPNRNQTVASSEGYPFAEPSVAADFAVSYCTQKNDNAPGHRYFPKGAITGAHFLKGSTYVQISGRIDAVAAGLDPKDGGGYYDLDQNVNSPPGGVCAGYDSFYNFVGPADGIFCIKCCKGISACEIFNGEKGCSVMVPGNYETGFDNGVAPPDPPEDVPTIGGNTSKNSTGVTGSVTGTGNAAQTSMWNMNVVGASIALLLCIFL